MLAASAASTCKWLSFGSRPYLVVNQLSLLDRLTLSMMTDYDTSKALAIVLDLKAESRTLAVMTKPDLYPKLEPIDEFLGMLDGSKGAGMKHGYHVVMMNPDVNLTHAAAMQKEEEYFKSDGRWATPEPSYQQKLGTPKLAVTLSRLLQEATRRNLPSALELIEVRLGKVQKRLQALPAPPGLQYLSIAMTHLINEFKDRMIKLFEGGGDADRFLLNAEWDNDAERFRTKLMDSRPRLRFSTKEENAQMANAERLIRDATLPITTPRRSGQMSEPISLSDEDTPLVKSESKIKTPVTPPAQTFHSFALEEIRTINQRHASGGLGSLISPGARNSMIKTSLQKFDVCTEEFLQATQKLIKDHATKHTGEVFRDYKDMPLFNAVMKHVLDYVDECCRQQYKKSMRMCETEMSKPFTLDRVSLAKGVKKYHGILKKTRTDYRLRLERTLHEAAQVGSKAKRSELKIKEDDLDDDEWDTEIELLATVPAYHQIAASRYVDIVCHSIYAHTFSQLAEEMGNSLAYFLGPMRPEQHDQMVRWMSENQERERERNRLTKEEISLLEARTLVEDALGHRVGKRKAGDGDVEMDGSGTENDSDAESSFKRLRFGRVDGLQSSVEGEDHMDED
jgi:hypothetical protein